MQVGLILNLKDFQLILWSVGFAFFPANWNTIKSGCFLNIKAVKWFFFFLLPALLVSVQVYSQAISFSLFFLLSEG